MIIQYPHIATIIFTTDSGADDKGYPLPPTESTVSLICRAEPNSSNAIINTADGRAYNFMYILYIQIGQADIPVNSRVTQIAFAGTGQILFTDDGSSLMTDDNSSITTSTPANNIQGDGIVKMYSRGQLNARLWL